MSAGARVGKEGAVATAHGRGPGPRRMTCSAPIVAKLGKIYNDNVYRLASLATLFIANKVALLPSELPAGLASP
jgi:hypothetical protein